MKWGIFLRPAIYGTFWILSILWVFLLGFMLGQSETPETALPFLQGVLPQYSVETSSNTVPVAENELTYSTILQKPNDTIVVPNEANVVEKDKKITATPKIPTQIVNTTTSTSEQIFRFSLQLLAVKQKKSAEEYALRLQDNGIPTEIVEASKNAISWYRVYTTFEGTVADFNTLKDKLASLGIVDTILRERIPM